MTATRERPPPLANDNTQPVDHPKPEGALLTFWIIYSSLSDFPGKVIVRPHYTMEGKPPYTAADIACWMCDTVEQARAILPPGCTNLGRQERDDPCITEVWVA